MNYKSTLKYLYGLESPKIKLGLENIQSLLDKIGNPEKKLRCIHVAGTNGKGSVCSMIFHALREAGYKVGIYTSPHMKKFNERIVFNGQQISDGEIAGYFQRMQPFITSQSFFEITTAIAFLYFRDKKPDFVVLEVGLGGRLDATNVIIPLVSVITNISLEHTELLGNTIEKVAFEKAGIIKPQVPVVTGAKGKALKVIRRICAKRNAPVLISKNRGFVKLDTLKGEFQQRNSAIALAAIEVLKKFYPEEFLLENSVIMRGIKKTRWQFRMQFVRKNILVDCAHNPAGFKVLKDEIILIKKKYRDIIFVLGIQKTKDAKTMTGIIHPLASTVIFTKSCNPQAFPPKELLEIFQCHNKKIPRGNLIIIGNPKAALLRARKIARKNDLIVVAGSIYMVGEIFS